LAPPDNGGAFHSAIAFRPAPDAQGHGASSTSVAGLAVKARMAAHACSHMYRAGLEDANWDHKAVRQLIAAVLTMAGQPLIGGEV
jgi:hypothetical protein